MGAYGGGLANPDAVEDDGPAMPGEFILMPNYPNPFNSATMISLDLPRPAVVELAIYDLLGRRVATLQRGRLAAGNFNVAWHAGNNPSGVYLARLRAGDFVSTQKMLLVK